MTNECKKSVSNFLFPVPFHLSNPCAILGPYWARSLSRTLHLHADLSLALFQTARYECAVHLGSLSNRVTAEVLVLSPGQLTCRRTQDGNVTWQQTAAGRQDIQPCPGHDISSELPGRMKVSCSIRSLLGGCSMVRPLLLVG